MLKDGSKDMITGVTAVVNEALAQVYADFEILSDEAVMNLIDLGDSEGGCSGKHWVLDPIDGTRGFENGRQYAVCLGLLQDGEPVLGVLGCPNMPASRFTAEHAGPSPKAGHPREGYGVLFAAIQGCGAFEGSLADTGTELHACWHYKYCTDSQL
jgi:3'(2'), 5'-bisphosphate nucleotidase / inositol polyphosphate 1-phosphatase